MFTVANRLDRATNFSIKCKGAGEWIVNLPAHGEMRGLGQLMNQDAYTNPCTWEQIP